MIRRFVFTAVISAAMLAGSGLAQTKITFWHSMAGARKAVTELAEAFNRSQKDYVVDAQMVGTYVEANTKLVAALRANNPPVLYQSDIGFFPKFVADGVLADLSGFEKTLPKDLVSDIYPAIWNYGVFNGHRYGLPWNASTPVLYYNATLLRARGLRPPTTWPEFATLAAALTNRGTKGFIAGADSWQFEQMVLSRGGSIVTPDGKPNFASNEAVEALTFLQNLVKNGQAIPRSIAEVQFGILDFVRTKAAMAIASIANWPDILPYSIAFELGVAPLPRGTRTVVPFGGAQLVVLKNSTTEEQRGAWAFWQFLMRPENIVAWTKASYYVPIRRSVLSQLEPWYRENPYRKVAFEQFDEAVARPREPGYAIWKTMLEEAIERALKDTRISPRQALEEAQRRAMAAR